jgi:hypothetical protein
MAFSGSCHCGKLAYTVDEDMPAKGMTCNCSICRRKGNIHHFTGVEKFTLEGSRDDATVYTFNTHNIRHQHCNTCGCAPFAEGKGPDGKAMVEINLRCVPDCDLNALEITEYDGASS